MALNQSGVDTVALAAIASADVQAQLADAAVLVGSVLNLSDRCGPGMKSIAIPRVSGMTSSAIKDDGTDSTSSGMTLAVDTLALTSKREVADYIYDTSLDSAVDLKAAFFESAPGVFVADMEARIYAELEGASGSSPDQILQMSGTGNAVPTIGDIRLASQLLDIQKVPAGDRWLAVPPAVKTAILSMPEITNAAAFGNSDAIQKGYIGELYGFKVICSNAVTAGTMVAYHRTTLAFAFQKDVTAVMARNEEKSRELVALRGHYGQKTLGGGKKAVLFNATGT